VHISNWRGINSGPDRNFFALAQSLGRPVAHGWLSPFRAEGAIAAVAARTFRGEELADALRIANHILQLNADDCGARMDTTSRAISYAMRPLIEMKVPKNRLLAQAHDVNADASRPLTEPEVDEVVKTAVWRSLQRGKRSGR
jgi:hypothetical protein